GRATLTVPGDSTDLQNVPWGQKATYCADGYVDEVEVRKKDAFGSRAAGTDVAAAAEPVVGPAGNEKRENDEEMERDKNRKTEDAHAHARRVEKERKQQQQQSQQQQSQQQFQRHDEHHYPASSEDGQNSDTPTESTVSPTTTIKPRSSRSRRRKTRHTVVFSTPRELETEDNPLIKRVGVDKLLGRTSPIVLTREYAYDPADNSKSQVHNDNGNGNGHDNDNEKDNNNNNNASAAKPTVTATTVDVNQATPSEEPAVYPLDLYPLIDRLDEARLRTLNFPPTITSAPSDAPASGSGSASASARRPSMRTRRMLDSRGSFGLLFNREPYEDYEQPLPSPWSQSPAPSPAPLSCEDENPFF
ncbi:hypothetical protein KEM56_004985, partial [Ascosphaera pollenicola]